MAAPKCYRKLNKEQIIDLIKSAKRVIVYYDERWRYPETGDTQGKCPMLQMNFDVEKKPGFVIHIPTDDERIKKLNKRIPAITEKDVYGSKGKNT